MPRAYEAQAKGAFGHSPLQTCVDLILNGSKKYFGAVVPEARPAVSLNGWLLQGEESQDTLDDHGRQQKSMPIKPVDLQHASLPIEMKRGCIVRKGRPHLRVEFENACFGQRR
jgi:hypothetical protein